MYDVVIIGSGLGGLACGHTLARKGLKVVVLERQGQPGGSLQSYLRKGRHFDTGMHYVGGLDEGQALHNLFADLNLLSLPWKRLDPEGFDRVTIEGNTYLYKEGFERFAENLSQDFPHEREALHTYVRALREMGERDGVNVSAWTWLNELFHDPLLIDVLSGTCLKMELRRDTLPLFSFVHNQGPFIESSWRLDGPGSLMVDRLIGDIRSYGGEVLCGEEVEELIERDEQIAAARTSFGNVYEGRFFISDAHPVTTLSWIKESRKIKGVFRRRMASVPNSFGMFTVSVVMKKGALPAFNHNKYIYARGDVWGQHECPQRPVAAVLVTNPAPDQIDILTPTLFETWSRWSDTSVGRRGEDYKALKSVFAEECIALAETQLPGLSSQTEEIYTSSPLTWRDYNKTPEGSAYGMRKDWQNPLMTILSPKMSVGNLFLTGQNVVLHGLMGVTRTAQFTCEQVINSL